MLIVKCIWVAGQILILPLLHCKAFSGGQSLTYFKLPKFNTPCLFSKKYILIPVNSTPF